MNMVLKSDTSTTSESSAADKRAIIAALDLSGVEERLVAKDGFAPSRARNAIALYRQFLTLVAEHPGESVCPPADADAAWHHHILDTRAYVADCQRIFGGYIHHDPYAFGTEEFDRNWQLTRERFASAFDVALPAAKTIGMSPFDAPSDAVPVTEAKCFVAPDGKANTGPEACYVHGTPDAKVGPEACYVHGTPDAKVGPEACYVHGSPDAKVGPEACYVHGTPDAKVGPEACYVHGTPDAKVGPEACYVHGTPDLTVIGGEIGDLGGDVRVSA